MNGQISTLTQSYFDSIQKYVTDESVPLPPQWDGLVSDATEKAEQLDQAIQAADTAIRVWVQNLDTYERGYLTTLARLQKEAEEEDRTRRMAI